MGLGFRDEGLGRDFRYQGALLKVLTLHGRAWESHEVRDLGLQIFLGRGSETHPLRVQGTQIIGFQGPNTIMPMVFGP